MIKVRKQFSKLINRIQSFVAKPWYVPMVALLAALDSFLIVFPIDVLLVTRFIFQREHWIGNAVLTAVGSALGCFLLAAFIKFDLPFISEFAIKPGSPFAHDWARGAQFIHEHGALGVGIVSVSFIPLQIAVIVAAGEKVPLLFVFLAALIGRATKYLIYGFISIYFPNWIRKMKLH